MENRINKKLIIRISISLICLFVMFIIQPEIFTHAQSNCHGPILRPNPTRNAWLTNTLVAVVIFDTPDATDFDIIDKGIRKWNEQNTLNCSNVTFLPAEPANFPYDPNQLPPEGTIWVTRDPDLNSQMDNHYRNIGTSLQSVKSATMNIQPHETHTHITPNYLTYVAAHETGHAFGLGDEYNQPNPEFSIMAANYRLGPTYCDMMAVRQVYCPDTPRTEPTPESTCLNPILKPGDGCPIGYHEDITGLYCCKDGSTPTPTPTPTPEPEDCWNGELWLEMRLACEASGGAWKGCRGCFSPVVIDIEGNGYNLTDGNGGVDFDLTGEGAKDRIAWTSANSDDAWLALDRNNNGVIDSALELFGNVTDQPQSVPIDEQNGFLALAEFDKADKGGNGDGVIDSQDSIFGQLRLWQDTNHNGISEEDELKTLPDLEITSIELDFKESKRTDEHGNRFRYRAKIWDAQKARAGRWAWDVFPIRPR